MILLIGGVIGVASELVDWVDGIGVGACYGEVPADVSAEMLDVYAL